MYQKLLLPKLGHPSAKNDMNNILSKIPRNTTVSPSPTVGGFAGYFKNGIVNKTSHIIPAKTRVFLKLFSFGNDFLEYANTIPNNAPIDVPRIVAAKICPPFCHDL